jgi:hypothetical protein
MKRLTTSLAVYLFFTVAAVAQERAAPLSALAKLPVREITIFKDGHAFVLHQGKMPTDAAGNVLLDHLPTPVIGTFWPYSVDKDVRLTSVTAARRRVLVEQTALTLRDLLEANVGADVLVNEGSAPYPATIVGFPKRSSEELETTSPQTAEPLPQKGSLILLKTAEGTKVVNVDRIQDVKFLAKYKTELANDEFRNLLTLKLDWGQARAGKTADVGLMYLQKGVRWIPSYLVDLDGNGKAAVKLQATLINEMTDLNDVTVNLVVGVPSFMFKDTIDPMALGQTIAHLTTYMEGDQQMANNYSNSMMTQLARTNEVRQRNPVVDLGPAVADGSQNEDLFLYTVRHVTLKKGQRLVLPVSEYALDYKDIFTLSLPFAPTPELGGNINDVQRAELARLLNAPKVQHKIRLVNKSNQPLTTAPTLIVSKNRVLAQSMMTYTSAGSYSDLAVTAAVDVRVKKSERETKRTPNAANWNGEQYWRLDLAGTLHLCNLRATATELEITRYVLGNVNEADHDGKVEMVNVLEDDSFVPTAVSQPARIWNWYNWPAWWQHFNGVGRITWCLKLAPGQTLDLGYTWHYYRR